MSPTHPNLATSTPFFIFCEREEKASLFRDQVNEFLTQDEGTKVKIALATFMETKVSQFKTIRER